MNLSLKIIVSISIPLSILLFICKRQYTFNQDKEITLYDYFKYKIYMLIFKKIDRDNNIKYIKQILHKDNGMNLHANLLLINSLIEKKEDINNNNLLQMMIQDNDIDAVKLLIEHNININKPNKQGINPIIYAIASNNYDIVDLLLKNGATVNIDDLQCYIISNKMKQILNKYNICVNHLTRKMN